MFKTRPRSGFLPVASTALPLVLALAVSAPLASPAAAQEDIPRGATVLERQRPEVDPLGVQLGGFMVYPSATVEATHDDNVFATANNERSDIVTVLAPAVRADSTWSVHDLKFGAGARIGRFADYTTEDFEDYYVNSSGKFEFTPRSYVDGRLAFNRLHEGRGDPDRSGGRTPTEFNLSEAGIGFFQGFNKVSGQVDVAVQHYDYKPQAGAGALNDERDITIYTTSLRGDYRIGEEYGVFGRLSGNVREPSRTPAAGRADRSSEGWEVDAGVAFDLTGVTFGEVFAGYREQYFSSAALKDIGGLSFGAEVVNNFTRLTTFTLRAETSVEETTIAGASSYLQNSYSFRADHELRRNILLNAGAGYSTYEYQGIDRDASRLYGGVGATWLANRHMHFNANYTYTDHDESGADARTLGFAGWDQNLMMLSVQFHL
ncbi:MAG: outer membrane beta-barrel protein [Rhodospirillaceae bacterium]